MRDNYHPSSCYLSCQDNCHRGQDSSNHQQQTCWGHWQERQVSMWRRKIKIVTFTNWNTQSLPGMNLTFGSSRLPQVEVFPVELPSMSSERVNQCQLQEKNCGSRARPISREGCELPMTALSPWTSTWKSHLPHIWFCLFWTPCSCSSIVTSLKTSRCPAKIHWLFWITTVNRDLSRSSLVRWLSCLLLLMLGWTSLPITCKIFTSITSKLRGHRIQT